MAIRAQETQADLPIDGDEEPEPMEESMVAMEEPMEENSEESIKDASGWDGDFDYYNYETMTYFFNFLVYVILFTWYVNIM